MTIGRYILIMVILLIAFNFIYLTLSWLVGSMNTALGTVRNATGGNAGDFRIFADFLNSTWSWLVYIVTNLISMVIILGLSLLYEAMEAEWRF